MTANYSHLYYKLNCYVELSIRPKTSIVHKPIVHMTDELLVRPILASQSSVKSTYRSSSGWQDSSL